MSKSKLKSHDLGYTPYLKHSTKTPISDDYDIQNKIGDGGFSIVKKGVRKSDGKEFAIKTVKKRKVPSHYILREVNIWKKASEHSPNRIVKLIEIYEDENAVNYVMELMEGGELFEKIVQMTDYSEVYAAKILKQLFKIVKEIHEIDIVHQDLKPENLLLTSKQGMSIKLCDFGLAEIAEDDHELTGVVGSRMYMAPEVEADKGHGKPVDYYAAGVIMYILLCGYPPFEPENGITVLEFPEPEWDNITPFAKELITQLLNPDPNKRPTPTQVLAHEWFKNVETINEPHSLNNTISNLRAFKNIGPGGTMKEYRGGKQSVIGLFAEQQQQQQQNGTKDAKISKHGSKHDISPRDSKPKHKSSTSTASSPSPSNPLTSSSSTVPSIKTASSDSVEPTTSPSSNPSSTPRGEPTTPKDKSKLKDPAPPKVSLVDQQKIPRSNISASSSSSHSLLPSLPSSSSSSTSLNTLPPPISLPSLPPIQSKTTSKGSNSKYNNNNNNGDGGGEDDKIELRKSTKTLSSSTTSTITTTTTSSTSLQTSSSSSSSTWLTKLLFMSSTSPVFVIFQ
eukprot:TRINITY_DN1884_c1_g1_i2.p1 TRINITY_DN1884_c1_g1~~TRINITY_DN1884_c1_g1_i2.p1  ORF type:complete len:564 (-),score=189.25 TRINITY_DN1884_c1_g1_i2:104-1795(-)